MYSSPVRHSPPIRASSYCAAVRLACVRPTASVHSEPGSNSSLKTTLPCGKSFECRYSIQATFRLHFYNLNVLVMIICKMDSLSFLQAPTQVTCAYFQRASKLASAPSSLAAAFPLQRAAHYRAVSESVNTSLRGLFELRFQLAGSYC